MRFRDWLVLLDLLPLLYRWKTSMLIMNTPTVRPVAVSEASVRHAPDACVATAQILSRPAKTAAL